MDTNDTTESATPAELKNAVESFLTAHNEDVMSASRVINPLLGLWKLANDQSREAAIPIEELLTVLPARKLVTVIELREVLARVLEQINEPKVASTL